MHTLFAAVAVLSACGGSGDGNTATETPAATPAPALPPAPSPAPPITATGPVYYFSDCQADATAGCVAGDNSNAGTSSDAPKRDLSGFNVNALPAGAQLLFQRGGSWNWANLRLENDNVTPTNPMVIDAYGSGVRPLFRVNLSGSAIDFGTYYNTSNDGGYTLRNVKFDGLGVSGTGLFLIHNLRNVTIESTELTGFYIAIQSRTLAPHGVTNVLISNNSISSNRGMGILGQFSDSVIEGNQFQSNNYVSGSGFNHGTYLSGNADGGRNIVLRNNRYTRNSVVGGVCEGGNMTFHGQMDGVLIEGNTIEQDAAAAGCWLMSITQGYDTAEWFTNFVVRNNRLINGGNTAIAAQSAPGILVEDNVIINTQTTNQTGISVGHTEYSNGDVADGNAVVRNNTACYPTPHANSVVVRVTAPDSQLTNNVMLTGAEASTGVCAP